MSLTQFIKNEQIRNEIDDAFPKQGESITKDIINEWKSESYSLIGTAYDYLFRFWIEYNADDCHQGDWVAYNALNVADVFHPEKVSEVKDVLDRAETEYQTYQQTGELTRELIEATLDLARLDTLYRSKQYPNGIGSYTSPQIVDLIALMETLNESSIDIFDDIGTVHLNPTFGVASALVGGADADAIIDGTLIDIKTTKNTTFKVGYWRQIIGYLILSDIHHVAHEHDFHNRIPNLTPEEPRTIDSFGIYFSRFDTIQTFDATEMKQSNEFNDLRKFFVEQAADRNDSRVYEDLVELMI